jgi:putative transposase
MTHSYRVHYFHLIWSTKNRTPWIDKEIQERLYPYLGGITKNHKGKLIEVGGMSDHIHMLIELSFIDKFSHFIRDLKSCSSLWIHQTFPQKKDFAWQEGYGSFSVSFSALEKVRDYIRNQEKHHEHQSFDQEYLKLLEHHRIQYDERFVLG